MPQTVQSCRSEGEIAQTECITVKQMADTQVGHYNRLQGWWNGGHTRPPLLIHHYNLFSR
ncbi:MAG TPA: hypothetical protein VFC69_07795 [Dysgonamonadaceae bacterium]|nr:hypothetical protein [Dysgonamonadaceae bacterium]